MYKLYISKGSCSLAPHIIIKHLNFPHAIIKVDSKTDTCEDGSDFLKVHANGWVPVLQLTNGEIITEVAVILQYLAELKPESEIFPEGNKTANFIKVQTQQWLSFISSELHKSFSPIFNHDINNEVKNIFRKKLLERFAFVDKKIKGEFLQGMNFTIPDAYLFAVSRWAIPMKVDISPFLNLTKTLDNIQALPATQLALEVEELKK